MYDYQGSFNAGMRSRETNYAYITSSDLDGLSVPEGETGLDLDGDLTGLGVGSAFWYTLGGGVHKNSIVAKAIWSPSRVVGNAQKTTSLYSLVLHRNGYGKITAKRALSWTGGTTYAGQLSRFLAPIGYLGSGLALYQSWTIGRKLGYWHGGDSWVRDYRQKQYMNRYSPK